MSIHFDMRNTVKRHLITIGVVAGLTSFLVMRYGVLRYTQLPHGYHVHRPSTDQVIVAPLTWHDDTPIIPAKAVGLWWNDSWMIGKTHSLKPRSSSPKDEIYEADPTSTQYWIIDFVNNRRQGPFHNERELLEAERKAGIDPDSVTFESPPYTQEQGFQ